MTSNKRRRHTPDQIIHKLAEGHRQLAAGRELDEVCQHLEIAESTWHLWLAQCSGVEASDVKRLKEFENPNACIGETNEVDHRRCLDIQRPYLSAVAGHYTDWAPLTNRPSLFDEDLDPDDPWSFRRGWWRCCERW